MRKKALTNSNAIARLLGNNYRMQEIKLGNTNYPSNLTKVRKNELRNRLTRKTGLFGVSMKNFGISLDDYMDILRSEYYNEKSTQRGLWKVALFLREVQKLIHHICVFYDHQSCHGDIRMSNIMIDPTTHTIRLIDFDYYGSFQQVSNAYMGKDKILKRSPYLECVPPEYLELRKEEPTTRCTNYAKRQLEAFPAYYTITYMITHNNNQSTTDPPPDLISKIEASLKNPILSKLITLQSTDPDTFTGITASFIDVFGLGLSLLELTIMLYLGREDLTEVDADTILKVIELLENMASFDIEHRLDPPTAKDEIDEIVKNYEGKHGGTRKQRTRKQRKRRASKN